jgi:hypothetical protein
MDCCRRRCGAPSRSCGERQAEDDRGHLTFDKETAERQSSKPLRPAGKHGLTHSFAFRWRWNAVYLPQPPSTASAASNKDTKFVQQDNCVRRNLVPRAAMGGAHLPARANSEI